MTVDSSSPPSANTTGAIAKQAQRFGQIPLLYVGTNLDTARPGQLSCAMYKPEAEFVHVVARAAGRGLTGARQALGQKLGPAELERFDAFYSRVIQHKFFRPSQTRPRASSLTLRYTKAD